MHGGAEALLYRMAVQPSDHEHVVVSFGPPAHYSSLLTEAGVEVHHLNTRSAFSGILGTFQLRRVMQLTQPDVVQCWMYRSNVVAGLAARSLGIPVVWGVHCSSFKGMGFRTSGWIRISGALAKCVPDKIINCSTRSAELHERIGYGRDLVDVVYNGYDADYFYPDQERRKRLRAELGIAEDVFLLGNVSRWHAQKDHPSFIASLRILEERQPRGWHCLLVGRGLDSANAFLADLIAEAGLDGLITCLGPRSDIADVMRALDLHVLSSAFGEAFPNVVAEAMASGTPCLVTDVGDSEFLVSNTGWVTPASDPERLAAGIQKAHREWSEQPDAWHARAQAARARIVERFTLAQMTERYEQIWYSAAATRPRRDARPDCRRAPVRRGGT